MKSPNPRRASGSPEEGGVVKANANFATLPLSVNQKLSSINNTGVNSRQAMRISAMSNAYSSKSRPTSLRSAIESQNNQHRHTQQMAAVSPRKAIELAKQEKITIENRVKYLANEQERYQKKIEKAR